MIIFRIVTHSGVAPYLQIVQQVKQALQMGQLQVGDKLPTAKEVVAMVVINPNTVAKAYRELEREGLVRGRAGIGTIVVGRPAGPPPEVQATLATSLGVWVAEAKRAGLNGEAIESLVQAVINEGEGNETNYSK